MCFPVKTKHMLFRLNHHMQHFYELNGSLRSLISASLPLVFALVHAHVCLLFLSKARAVTGRVYILYSLSAKAKLKYMDSDLGLDGC